MFSNWNIISKTYSSGVLDKFGSWLPTCQMIVWHGSQTLTGSSYPTSGKGIVFEEQSLQITCPQFLQCWRGFLILKGSEHLIHAETTFSGTNAMEFVDDLQVWVKFYSDNIRSYNYVGKSICIIYVRFSEIIVYYVYHTNNTCIL